MKVQAIEREGQPEYAVLAWSDYQQLLAEAGRAAGAVSGPAPVALPAFSLARLAELRAARGLDPAQLAREVGISPHYLAMIERGERQPDGAVARALERFFSRPQE